MIEYRFSFKCSYMGCTWYMVSGDGESYSVELRREAEQYERERTSYDDATWTRDVVGAVGLLRREYRPDHPIAQAVVDAFNAWRAREHEQHTRKILGAPERYGVIEAGDILLRAPEPARGARYDVAHGGWIINAA